MKTKQRSAPDPNWAENSHCTHEWVAGMMYVADEDLPAVAAVRTVRCQHCDKVATEGVDF